MTASAVLPIDVILGIPEPSRSRWQPLRAGILNLFLYDEQVFAFHNGRLLLRGNNGTGKSMALEVLLPYLLDAELTPSRLSTFGGSNRTMRLWLIDFDKTGARTSERGYTWVEFGRRLTDGRCEYFTAGAMLEGTSDSPVKAHYFTTAARIGVHFSVGRPGTEPLNAKQLGATLAEQTAIGRPGGLHPDPASHRAAVNDRLFRLADAQYAALRRTLLQLRRPKLSDKLDEKGLSGILRDSLPPVSDAIVSDLAEGFERLDRHAAAVSDLEDTIRHLRRIRDAYRAYARATSAARADAVAAAESAITEVSEKTTAAQQALDSADLALAAIAGRRAQIGLEFARIRGRTATLTQREAYRKGSDVKPLRDLVASLDTTAAHAEESAQRAEHTRGKDAEAAARAMDDAVAARDHCGYERDQAVASARQAHTQTLDAQLAAALEELTSADIRDGEAADGLLARARELIGRLGSQISEWEAEVASLAVLSRDARKHAAALGTARSETSRARADVEEAEEILNQRLEEDNETTLAWIGELNQWAARSGQLRAGQAAPLPWDPATALDHAPRWAAEAAAARTAALITEQKSNLVAAAGRDSAAAAAADVARRAEEMAALLVTASDAATARADAVAAYRSAITAWASAATELCQGEAAPDPASWPPESVRHAAITWADRAAANRTSTLLAERAAVRAEASRATTVIADLSGRENHLAEGGLPGLAAPPTRRATRDLRAGGPLYMLVDFASTVSETDRLGIEAAALGSGIADAWLSPDGRLVAGEDGKLLLDTQLDAFAFPSAGPTLADVLVADDNAARTGVPASVVASVLTRIGCTASAQATGPETRLVVGRDGSWRMGALTGAFQVDAVTLIGASNREAARLAALMDVRRELAQQREAMRRLEEQDASIGSSLTRLERERANLPPDDQIRRLSDEARDAASKTAIAASGIRAAARPALLMPPPLAELEEEPGRSGASEAAAAAELLASEVFAAPAAGNLARPARELTRQASAMQATWAAAAERLRARADHCATLCAVVEQERAAIPDAAVVRAARSNVATAVGDLTGARGRLTAREEEEEAAQRQARTSNGMLRAALLANSLPDDCDTDALAAAVRRYQTSAQQWLRAGADQLRTAAAAQLAHSRSIDSAQTAQRERAEADRQATLLLEKKTELETLTSSYGSDYQQIVAELADLQQQKERLEQEQQEAGASEKEQIKVRADAKAALANLDQRRNEAEAVRAGATAAFLAAHQLGLLSLAGLPDAPPGTGGPETGTGQPETVTSVGVRAARDWARAIREAAGDRVRRDFAAVEAAANRVNETRYQLEPDLAGKVSVRDEHRDGLLILHASRASHVLTLPDMITVLAGELTQAQHLLAAHEAELFRMFLANATRREVTSKVRDARTAIKTMSALISGHPTGSGIQVRLNWVPDEKNAPGMQEIVALMAKDAPLESERERLQEFFRSHLAAVRAAPDADYKAQMERLLDYRQWWRFTISFRRGPEQAYEPLTGKSHGSLSGGEKAVCLHLPLFAAAASYCDSAGLRATEPDGSQVPGSPRLILLDEVFAGVDEDNRGDLFELVRTLDLDLVATSESEQGFYRQLDGLAVYQLVGAADAILGTRTLWDGKNAHRMPVAAHTSGAEGGMGNGHPA